MERQSLKQEERFSVLCFGVLFFFFFTNSLLWIGIDISVSRQLTKALLQPQQREQEDL